MASTYNPFAPVERSKVETPWGVFEVAPPNKARLAQIEQLQREGAEIPDDDMAGGVRLAIRLAAAGVLDGEKLQEKLEEAWDAGDVNLLQIRSMSEFVGNEIAGEVAAAGND
jgi:hypothetical protein